MTSRLAGEYFAEPGHVDMRLDAAVHATYACPQCGTTGPEVLSMVRGAFCCCRSCGQLWVDDRQIPSAEPSLKRRRTDHSK
jgi:ribosomal protein L37AE/L43A